LRPAPLHILGRQVKALKGLQPAAVSTLERLQARNALGETFGTKKALAAIRANERNKVDVSAMESAVGRIQDTVAANTASLPTLGVCTLVMSF
jgi:DNA-directed RNA polymerase I subunit RPA49